MIRPFIVLLLVGSAAADDAKPVEQQVLYHDGGLGGVHASTWSMSREARAGGGSADGRHLWLNHDWQAQPWAGLAFRGGKGFTLTREWLDHGFVRFLLNATVDRYGHPAGDLKLQLKPEGVKVDYVRLQSQFIDRGRGRDEDEASWQEVLMPLALWRDLKPGDQVNGLGIQTVQQATLAFGVDEVGFVRFDRLPGWYEAMRNVEVAQPWVEWPAYDDLPDLLKADRHPPQVRDGAIVRPDGSRVFFLNPYTREDQGLDLSEGKSFGLYDPDKHGWIYRERLSLESLSRLGFNSLSVTMSPAPWWRQFGYEKRDHRDASLLPQTRDRAGVPFYVDTVCWPYTLGVPAAKGLADKEAITQGRNHWTPYRIIGKGRETWLQMWRTYAGRYARHEVPVPMFELMNEPAYVGHSSDHLAEFAGWLERRHGTVADLNGSWRSGFAGWAEASRHQQDSKIEGQVLDYDEYLAERFAELIRDGAELVREQLPHTLVGVQSMGGYVRRPREAVWKHKLVPHETVVLTPTGGGTWTPGGGNREAPPRALEAGIAAAPFENDLLLSMAGDKMIFDNEFYSRGTDAVAMHDRLWRHVIVGLDGLSTFSWAKRGWVWHGSRDKVVDEAENFPYSMLNPVARPTASLRGIHDFARSIQPVSHLVLPKPWGPAPRIALLHSWANVRHRVLHPELPDKTESYFQALKYSHWNMELVASDRILREPSLAGFEVVILAGVTHVEPELVPVLDAYVRHGGTLVIGEALFDQDVYGNPVVHDLAGVKRGEDLGSVMVASVAAAEGVLPGPLRIARGLPRLNLSAGVATLVEGENGEAVVTRRSHGQGRVYFQAADLAGYPLAKLMWGILGDAADPTKHHSWRLVELRDGKGQLATNILLSRRSHEDNGYHAILLKNEDRHDKSLRLKFAAGPGDWKVHEHITDKGLGRHSSNSLSDEGLDLALPAGRPAVLILKRD